MSSDPRGADARRRIVFLSHTPPNPHLVVGSHHLSRELARQGHAVAHAAGPVSLLHVTKLRDAVVRGRLRVATRRARADRDGVVQAVPLTAVPLGQVGERGQRAMLGFPSPWRAELVRSFREPDVVFVDQPLLVEFARILRPRRLVYRPTDAHYDPAVRAAEIRLIAHADAIVATSASVLDQVTDGTGWSGPSTVLENGVDFDHFAAPAHAGTERTGFVYVGAVDRRFDWAIVRDLALALPDETFDIIGPVSVGSPDLPANVRVVGPVPYADVPARLHRARIGLLPLSDDPGNAGRSPMKYYEYLAAGLQILARTSPALAARTAPGVVLYSETTSAIAGARALLLDHADGVDFAREFSWSGRARQLLEFTEGRG